MALASVESHSSQPLPSAEGLLTRMPDAVITTHLLPFLDRPVLSGERGPDGSLRQLTRRWFSSKNILLLNRRFRDLVDTHRRAEGNSQSTFHGAERRIIDYINSGTPQRILEHISRGCHLVSLRIFFHRNPLALLNPQDMDSVLHVAVSPHPGRAAFSLSFVSFLCEINRQRNLGLIDKEDEQHRRPIDRLCSSGLRAYAIVQTLPLLLEGGRDINQRNSQGHTALHYAAEAPISSESTATLHKLLERGADPNLLNGARISALEIYVRNVRSYLIGDPQSDGWQGGIELLLNHGAEVTFSLLKYVDPTWDFAGHFPEFMSGGGAAGILAGSVALRIREAFLGRFTEYSPNWLLRGLNGETYLHLLISLPGSGRYVRDYCQWMDTAHFEELQEQFSVTNKQGQTPLELAQTLSERETMMLYLKQYAPFDLYRKLQKCQREGRPLSLGGTRETSLEIYVKELVPLLTDGWKLKGWEEGIELLLRKGTEISFSLLKYVDPTSEFHNGDPPSATHEKIRAVFQKYFAKHPFDKWLLRGPKAETYMHCLASRSSWAIRKHCEWIDKYHPQMLRRQLVAKNDQGQTPLDVARLADKTNNERGLSTLEAYAPIDLYRELRKCKHKGVLLHK